MDLYSFFTYYIYLKIEIEDKLREAILVGNIIEVNLIDDFINIKIEAFNDVVEAILKTINKIIYSPNLTSERDDIFFFQTNMYISSISDINEYWKYIIKMNFYIKNRIKTIKKKENNLIEEVIKKVNDINHSMIVYMYFYGSLNENESKNIFELFIKKESNENILVKKLDKTYNILNISDFMNQFTNIKIPLNNSTIYNVNVNSSKSTEKNVQVFYYFGNYTKEKYNKLFLLSKILNANHSEINVEVKILNGLFLFLEKSDESSSYRKIEDSIDYLLKNNSLSLIRKQYSNNNNENGIEQFYYLKNNFVTYLNKDNLNLIERADATINKIFYNNIQFKNNQSININDTDTNKSLKKIELNDVSDTFLKNSFKNVKRLSIRIGHFPPNTPVEDYKVTIFEKNFYAVTQSLT